MSSGVIAIVKDNPDTYPLPGVEIWNQPSHRRRVVARKKDPDGGCWLLVEGFPNPMRVESFKYWMKPLELGAIVHKRYFQGWWGRVQSIDLDAGTIEVMWDYNPYSSTVPIAEIRREGEPFGGYQRAQPSPSLVC